MADAGWYPDPSDATAERYWDGSTWTTSTRLSTAAAAPPPPPVGFEPVYQPPTAPPYQPSQFQQPYPSQPPYPPQYQQPYPAYGAPGVPGAVVAIPMNAPIGKRIVALLIDSALAAGPLLVAYVIFIVLVGITANSSGSGVGAALAAFLVFAAILWAIGFGVYNTIIRQGRTGQSIGKAHQKLRLVRDIDLQPIGAGMAAVRYFVPALISNVTCGIYGIVDYLFPLWEPNRKRLSDKWLNFSVVEA